MAEENIFKKIGPPPKEVPLEVKETLLANIESSKVFMDLVSLFTQEYPLTVSEVFKKVKQNK